MAVNSSAWKASDEVTPLHTGDRKCVDGNMSQSMPLSSS